MVPDVGECSSEVREDALVWKRAPLAPNNGMLVVRNIGRAQFVIGEGSRNHCLEGPDPLIEM